MVIVACHQPNFLPWLGFFHKILQCDIFVLLDNAQFVKGGFVNRCRIKEIDHLAWLTIPVKTKGHFEQPIRDVEINNLVPWRKIVLRTLETYYRKARFFNTYFPMLSAVFNQSWDKLFDLNLHLLRLILKTFGISTELRLASTLNTQGQKSSLIISIAKAIGADGYYSGMGARQYQRGMEFSNAGILLMYSSFEPFHYPQLGKSFIPNLSIIDFLFNCGGGQVEQLRSPSFL